MTLSEMLIMLKPYLGPEMYEHEYVQSLVTKVMREPNCDEEEALDNEEKYYPYTAKTVTKSVKDRIGRVYSGQRHMTKKDASQIKSHYDDTEFRYQFDALEVPVREKLVLELADHGVATKVMEVDQACADLMREAVWALAEGKHDFLVPAKYVYQIEPSIPVPDDMELKRKYGVDLLSMTGNRCPNDACFKPLFEKETDRSSWNYVVPTIDPAITVDTPDNLIALCPECSARYSFTRDPAKIARMKQIKQQLVEAAAADDYEPDKITDGIKRVVAGIAQIPFEKGTQLNYQPVGVERKLRKDNVSLYLTIWHQVAGYFPDVEEAFRLAETKHGLKYERFSQQIKWYYEDLRDHTDLNQGQIFDKIVAWVAGQTNEDKRLCEIVVSYFVQKCEVFDAITE